jgi:hypothetical protein
MLEPCDGKLSRTVLRGKGAERLVTYPMVPHCFDKIGVQDIKRILKINDAARKYAYDQP